METLDVLNEFREKKLAAYPEITYSNLYKRVLDHIHFEFELEGDKSLFSPYYVLLLGNKHPGLMDFVSNCEPFLDSLKKYILNSLFVYSALIDENSYYLSNPHSIFIARMIHKKEARFEVKFYTHYEEELLSNYKDKIYIGRDFLNLRKFDRKYLGLKKYFRSLIEQNEKVQERAKQKLRYFKDYEAPYMNEINYLTEETVADAMERIKLFEETKLADISKSRLPDVLDNILYLANLMIELRDLTQEFENKLRLSGESDFAKYLTKFLKDITDGIRFLRKVSCQMHMRISDYSIC